MEKNTSDISSVVEVVSAITGELAAAGIAKTRENKAQNYYFRGIDDVYNALAPLLAKYQLVIIGEVLERVMTERETANGKIMFHAAVRVSYALSTKKETSGIPLIVWGEAMDTGDKSTIKAMSAAYKTMALQLFCIPTEGDNDADASAPEAVKKTQMDKGELSAALKNMQTAPDTDALKKIFTEATGAARMAKDADAITQIMNAKNARKAQLEKAREPGEDDEIPQ